jgi:hypothetical protein
MEKKQITFVVEKRCEADPYYSWNMVAIFNTEEKAKAYIMGKPKYMQKELKVTIMIVN